MMSNKTFFFGIRFKMILSFGLLCIILLTAVHMVEFYGVPFTDFKGEYKDHESEIFRKLNLVADLKKERLLRWIEERYNDMDVLAESSLVKNFVKSINKLIRLNSAKGTGDAELWHVVKKEASYLELNKQLHLVKTVHGVYDVIEIVDKHSNMIVATTDSAHAGKKNPHKEIFDNIVNPGDMYVGLVENVQERGTFTLLIAHGIDIVNHEKKIIAALILYVNSEDFVKPMLHTGGGLGRTGEALLVDGNRKILVPLKHPLIDGTMAIPLEYEITAKPAVFAARGEEGIIISEDYRGVKVLAAFRHIRITSEMGWGMVVKRDLADAYASLWKSRNYTKMVGFIGALFAFIFVGLIANRLTRPIQLMSQAARRVEAGDLTARVPVVSSDEIGFLAQSFNSMVEHVQHWTEELEEQVKIRTAQLNAANQQLGASEQQLKASNQQLRASEQQLKAANQQLGASEQQLKAFNQQLRASEQQLKASNQQLRASEQQLKASNQQLRASEQQLKALLKTKDVLLKEVHHRVKNNLQIVNSLLYLETKNIRDKKILNIFKRSQERINAMAFIHEKLYQSKDFAHIDIADYIKMLGSNLFNSYSINRDMIMLNIQVASNLYLGVDIAIPCGLIINELVSNSLKYAFSRDEKGEIRIEFSCKDDMCTLMIGDNGVGFPKGFDFRNAESLGLQLVLTLIKQLNGDITLVEGKGTTFKITFKNV